MKPTVEQYLFKLTQVLTQYDIKESMREAKRGGFVNIYRLANLFEAAERVRELVKPHLHHNDVEALCALTSELGCTFTLRCVDKLIAEIEAPE